MPETLPAAPAATGDELPYAVHLDLKVVDPDTIRALERYADEAQRNEFALEALKVGVLALRHVAGALDTDFIQGETTRLLESLRRQLDEHSRLAQERLTGSLKEYFDPESGRFNHRVKRLMADDGDISQLLRGQLDGDDSLLSKTLLSHFGENSPLMKVLSPDQSQGLLALLRNNVEGQLTEQRKHLLKEFSLDNPEGALKRLVTELTDKHGDFTKDMRGKIDEVVKEFSLDEENSALSRLVHKVDRAQRKITDEFSLDNDQSALRRLKEELVTILSAHVKTNAEFQEEVKVALGKLVTKRETEARGTQHGTTFQDVVYEFVARDAQARGDQAEDTGGQVGLIKNRKVGDVVVELGADSAAAGAKIVLEAKEDASYTLAKARAELEVARKNRGAQLGIFVFSRRSAPQELQPVARYGNDIVMVWDAEDPLSDAYLRAALEIARALCVRQAAEQEQVDFQTIDKAILDIEKRAGYLDQIRTSAQTIKSSSEKIIERVDIDQQALEKQVTQLQASIGDLKTSLGAQEAASQ